MKHKIKWTKDVAIKYAKKCKNRNEMNLKYCSGYRLLSKLNLLDEYFGKLNINPKNYWTKNKITEEAQKYNSTIEFKKNCGSAYSAAYRLNILKELFPEKKTGLNNRYWTFEKLLEIDTSKMTRSKFRTLYSGAYKFARDNDLLDHLIFEEAGSLSKRCIYSIEFCDNHVYVGLTCNFDQRIYDHFNAETKISSAREHFNKTKSNYTCIQLSEYMDKEQAKIEEECILNIYKKDNWITLNKIKTGGLGTEKSKWTKEKVLLLALKYKRPYDFEKSEDRGAYRYASKHGFIKELKYKQN